MTHPPNKKPTDAAVVKALTKYEESFNVFLAEVKNSDRIYKELEEDDLYTGLSVARNLALRAQKRIDEKNLSKEKA